jgi:type IV secretion system protein VirB9
MLRVVLCSLLLLAGTIALAADAQGRMGADGRIRHVVYDPDEVVTIEAVVGVATHIVLEPGETYLTHAFGDGKAWDFAVKGNHCFLKAVATDADSNLTIVTDRRSYHFSLRLTTAPGASPTFELIFQYPDRDARRKREDGARRAVEEGFASRSGPTNLDYTMSGDFDLAPVNAWDDGEFTYFKFPGNRDLPAIYLVDPDGQESIVNRHSTGASSDVIVVHRVAQRWVLRLGARALAIWNDAFDPAGRANTSRTASPDVNRVLWR